MQSREPNPSALPPVRMVLLLLSALAAVPHLGALANGFAGDDLFILLSNPIVRSGDLGAAIRAPWWPPAFTFEGSGLYRPLTAAALTLQWSFWGERALGFHVVGLLLHVGVVLLLYRWLSSVGNRNAALVGAALFAVHPLHVEAIANTVGQAELWAAILVLAAVLLFDRWMEESRVGRRIVLMLMLAVTYSAAVSAKEIAVTLPALLVVSALLRGRRVRGALPVLALLAGVLTWLLAVRLAVLGSLKGEVPAPELLGLSSLDRVRTGLSVWLDYARLSVWPFALSADYGPAVRFPATSWDVLVLAGLAVLIGVLILAWRQRRRVPLVAAGITWFVLAVLPVSNLFFGAGVLLAERTLYLPSLGLALIVAGAWPLIVNVASPRLALTLAAGVVLAFAARSAARVPVWRDAGSVLASLERDHPESHLVLRRRALMDMEQGRTAEARAGFEHALALVPRHFSLLTEAAQFEALVGATERAEALAHRAIAVYPSSPHGYVVLARIRRGAGDLGGARNAALEGIRLADPLAPLWTEVERSRTMRQTDPP